MIGQIGDRLVVMVDDLAEVDSRTLLVLAKLSVGGLQIGKIDAAKRLVFSLVIACGSSIAVAMSSSRLIPRCQKPFAYACSRCSAAVRPPADPRCARTASSPRPACWSPD